MCHRVCRTSSSWASKLAGSSASLCSVQVTMQRILCLGGQNVETNNAILMAGALFVHSAGTSGLCTPPLLGEGCEREVWCEDLPVGFSKFANLH